MQLTKCIVCGNKKRTFKSRQRKYCSHKCQGVPMMGNTQGFTSKNMKGNKNGFKKGHKPWNYIDGRSKFISPARYGSDWKKIRTRILIRDDYECQKCGAHKSEVRFMDVHHKKSFLISRDNSEDNLIALCRKCHVLVEREVN